jgi:HEAT repeat protein
MKARGWLLVVVGGLAAALAAGAYFAWDWWRHRTPVYEQRTLAQWMDALKDPDPARGQAAVDALARIGPDAVPALLEARADKEDIVLHRRAAAALVRIGAPAAPGLVAVLTVGNRGRVETALVRMGPEAVPALVSALGQDNRAEAARVLGLIGPRASAAAPALVSLLQDRKSFPAARAEAAEALGAIGPTDSDVLDALSAALRDEDATVRQRAAEALGRIGPAARPAVPALVAALKDKSDPVIVAACRALGRVGDGGAAAGLLAVVESDRGPALDAALALVLLGPQALPAVPALVTLSRETKGAGPRARAVLVRLGPAAVPALRVALEDSDADVRLGAAALLGAIGPAAGDAVPALRAALADKEAKVVKEAARALAFIDPAQAREVVPVLLRAPDDLGNLDALAALGPDAAAAVPALVAALADGKPKDARERQLAASQRALFRIGAAAAGALIAALADTRPGVAPHAAEALGVLGPAVAAKAVPALRDALKRSAADRIVLARTLGQMGPAAADAIPDLEKLLNDRDARCEVAVAIARIDAKRAGPAVAALVADLQGKDDGRRAAAAWAVAQMGPPAKDAVPALRVMLHERPLVGTALRALGLIGPDAREAVGDLVALFSDRTQPLALVVQTLAAIGSDAVGRLEKALASPDRSVRILAADALIHMGPEARGAVGTLTATLADPDRDVRRLAAEALAAVGPDARAAVPALTAGLGSGETDTRIQAAHTLRSIGRDAAGAAGALAECLMDFSTEVRYEAALALGTIQPPDPPIPALVHALRDSSLTVRLAAADTLLRLDPAQGATVAPVLGALASSPYPGVSLEAAAALRRIDPGKVRQALPALRDVARGEDDALRLRAAVLLLEIDPDEARTALPPVQDALRDPSLATRLQALHLLAQAGSAARACAPWVARTLSDPHAEVRREAGKTLEKIAPGEKRR